MSKYYFQPYVQRQTSFVCLQNLLPKFKCPNWILIFSFPTSSFMAPKKNLKSKILSSSWSNKEKNRQEIKNQISRDHFSGIFVKHDTHVPNVRLKISSILPARFVSPPSHSIARPLERFNNVYSYDFLKGTNTRLARARFDWYLSVI